MRRASAPAETRFAKPPRVVHLEVGFLSTILDALRKAQAKQDEDEPASAPGRDTNDRSTSVSKAMRSAADDDLATFDEPMPAYRLGAAAQRSNAATALAVGLLGLGLGVGAARMLAGNFSIFGGSDGAVEVASHRDALVPQTDSKKSDAVAQPGADKRVIREARARSAQPLKVEREGGPIKAPAPVPATTNAAPPVAAPEVGAVPGAPGGQRPADVVAGAPDPANTAVQAVPETPAPGLDEGGESDPAAGQVIAEAAPLAGGADHASAVAAAGSVVPTPADDLPAVTGDQPVALANAPAPGVQPGMPTAAPGDQSAAGAPSALGSEAAAAAMVAADPPLGAVAAPGGVPGQVPNQPSMMPPSALPPALGAIAPPPMLQPAQPVPAIRVAPSLPQPAQPVPARPVVPSHVVAMQPVPSPVPGAPPAHGLAAVPFGAPAPARHLPLGAPVQTASLEPNALAPGMPTAPGSVPEPTAGTVLESVPSGAPEVSLLFIKWSRGVEGRVASLRGPGGKLMLVHEGDIVEGMRVSAIRADAIELQWRGTNFLLFAAR